MPQTRSVWVMHGSSHPLPAAVLALAVTQTWAEGAQASLSLSVPRVPRSCSSYSLVEGKTLDAALFWIILSIFSPSF
ncbi:Hypothetical predicted protein [Lynx pardinus]|uniref:Uncharacterized protein n=1 Tax=Lynx pardinus TaxID=191816 RepID=A0A485NND7_LYNPA|nr:Hypothetical predicted protein [Lynx pardinus]